MIYIRQAPHWDQELKIINLYKINSSKEHLHLILPWLLNKPTKVANNGIGVSSQPIWWIYR